MSEIFPRAIKAFSISIPGLQIIFVLFTATLMYPESGSGTSGPWFPRFASDGSCTKGRPEVGAQSSRHLPERAVGPAIKGINCPFGDEDPV